MDDELKKLAQQIQAQKLGTITADDQTAIQQMANMEPPRPDYSNAIKKDRFNRTKQLLGALPNTVAVDENYVAPVSVKEVYPSEQQELSAQQKAMKSIRDAFNGDPNYKSMEDIERIRKILGSK